eukprot:TRINITY_DN2240_c0_g1_i2.p1 TRINITY_DN2240_c0_g1~~TRINITY_DN2240_c0_g1_i2.p1  ORF type:complete len:305 (-),score=68.43 TRINITY_DN2240_c0_g1_i2:73-987(-)
MKHQISDVLSTIADYRNQFAHGSENLQIEDVQKQAAIVKEFLHKHAQDAPRSIWYFRLQAGKNKIYKLKEEGKRKLDKYIASWWFAGAKTKPDLVMLQKLHVLNLDVVVEKANGDIEATIYANPFSSAIDSCISITGTVSFINSAAAVCLKVTVYVGNNGEAVDLERGTEETSKKVPPPKPQPSYDPYGHNAHYGYNADRPSYGASYQQQPSHSNPPSSYYPQQSHPYQPSPQYSNYPALQPTYPLSSGYVQQPQQQQQRARIQDYAHAARQHSSAPALPYSQNQRGGGGGGERKRGGKSYDYH